MAVLVGKQAPDFTATAVYGNNEIKELKLSSFKGKPVVLFFYPLDFTFVCPSELIAFDHRLAEFKQRGAADGKIVGDSEQHRVDAGDGGEAHDVGAALHGRA